MKKINFGKLLFGLLNFYYTVIGSCLNLFLIKFMVKFVSMNIFKIDPVNTNNDWIIYSCMYFFFIYVLSKFVIFPTLYYFRIFSYICEFFDKFRTNKIFMWKVLGISFLMDIVFLIISIIDKDIFYFFLISYLTPCYIIFLILFPATKEEKLSVENPQNSSLPKSHNIRYIIFITSVITIFLLFTLLYLLLIFTD